MEEFIRVGAIGEQRHLFQAHTVSESRCPPCFGLNERVDEQRIAFDKHPLNPCN